MATKELPIRESAPVAGGGRPTDNMEGHSIPSLKKHIQAKLHDIYKTEAKSSILAKIPHNTYEDFESWFTSPAASALAPPPDHDLNYPLSNYYISSSHNTYLSGNQFYGAATGDAYKNVLLRGCRCLEIDVWDGTDDDSSISSSDMEDAAKHLTRTTSKSSEHGRSRFGSLKSKIKDKAAGIKPGYDHDVHQHHVHHHHHSHDPAKDRSRGDELENDLDELDKEAPKSTDVGISRAVPLGASPELLRKLSASEVRRLKAEPRVKHGFTLTKEIPFRLVCRAIQESAFVATDLPLIVSLEVHCTLEQQQIMVEILRSVFKNHLVDVSNRSGCDIKSLPSPDELRGKILIKVKWAANTETGESNNPLELVESTTSRDSEKQSSSPEKKQKAAKVLGALSDLGVYTQAYSFKQFDRPEAKLPTHVFSLSEAKVKECHANIEIGPQLLEHNRNFLMRVYPSGMRLDSSNLEPCFLWHQGAQMVALNWQSLDAGMMLNEAMFAGEAGWVLKPEGMRSQISSHESNTKNAQSKTVKTGVLDLEVKLIAAQNLPLPHDKGESHRLSMKPYVKLQLHVDCHGSPSPSDLDDGSRAQSKTRQQVYRSNSNNRYNHDGDSGRFKWKSKSSRSADADFGGEKKNWNGIENVVDELSFLRFKIQDDRSLAKDDLVAWACIKLSRLREGYRLIHLLDYRGMPSDGVLLVRIRKSLTTLDSHR